MEIIFGQKKPTAESFVIKQSFELIVWGLKIMKIIFGQKNSHSKIR